MATEMDLLQIKIEAAKGKLPEETRRAIDAVDWRAAILKLRETKGYNYEQLGDLELETELLLCGLLSPENYPLELEKRMGIQKIKAIELVNEMKELVFNKIREELIKNTERKKINTRENKEILPVENLKDISIQIPKSEINILDQGGVKIINEILAPTPTAETISTQNMAPVPGPKDALPVLEKLELAMTDKKPVPVHPILMQKLSESVQNKTIKTEYGLNNPPTAAGEVNSISTKETPKSKYTIDPYRMPPE